jgi:hypothetical protein
VETNEMNKQPDFLLDKVLRHDLVLVHVTGAPRPQVLRAKIGRIYSTGEGVVRSFLNSEVEFIRSGGTWGDVALKVDEQALLFVKSISGKLYEDPWHGHMIVEDIEGDLYAIYPRKELWLSDDVPTLIRESSRQDPKRSYATAIHFDVMEEYLLGLVERYGEDRS